MSTSWRTTFKAAAGVAIDSSCCHGLQFDEIAADGGYCRSSRVELRHHIGLASRVEFGCYVGRSGGRHGSTDIRCRPRRAVRPQRPQPRWRSRPRAARRARISLTPQDERCTCSPPTRRRLRHVPGNARRSGRHCSRSAPATASGGASASLLGTTTRADGTTQITYAGHPLYYFAKDTSAGMTAGQGVTAFGAKWWLVTPAGKPIVAAAAAAVVKPTPATTAPKPSAPTLPSPSAPIVARTVVLTRCSLSALLSSRGRRFASLGAGLRPGLPRRTRGRRRHRPVRSWPALHRRVRSRTRPLRATCGPT